MHYSNVTFATKTCLASLNPCSVRLKSLPERQLVGCPTIQELIQFINFLEPPISQIATYQPKDMLQEQLHRMLEAFYTAEMQSSGKGRQMLSSGMILHIQGEETIRWGVVEGPKSNHETSQREKPR